MTHLANITYVGYEYTLLLLPWMFLRATALNTSALGIPPGPPVITPSAPRGPSFGGGEGWGGPSGLACTASCIEKKQPLQAPGPHSQKVCFFSS
jgi:hypothetical protein|eukprot:COSAG01_NODE_191_length_22545_cov_259.478838_10_plen_94_part_00